MPNERQAAETNLALLIRDASFAATKDEKRDAVTALEDFSEKVVLPGNVTIEEAEKQLILKTLEQTRNNKAEAARRLGLDVKTIRNKLKSYGLM